MLIWCVGDTYYTGHAGALTIVVPSISDYFIRLSLSTALAYKVKQPKVNELQNPNSVSISKQINEAN